MYKLFNIAGYDKPTVDKKFSGSINTLSLRLPHGGIAQVLMRIVMLIANEKNIEK